MVGYDVEADLKLLGRDFTAVFQKCESDERMQFLFAPQKGSVPVGMSIKSFTDGINAFISEYSEKPEIIQQEKITEKLSDVPVENPTGVDTDWYEDIELFVDQAFIYYKAPEKPKPNGSIKKVKADEKKGELQYALQISLKPKDHFPKTDFFDFKRLSLAIWNCNIEKILDSMQIYDIQEYIEG